MKSPKPIVSFCVLIFVALILSACNRSLAGSTSKIKQIIWSGDNQYAVLIAEEVDLAGNFTSKYETWLTDAQLNPIKCLISGKTESISALASFSGDSRSVYYTVPGAKDGLIAQIRKYRIADQSTTNVLAHDTMLPLYTFAEAPASGKLIALFFTLPPNYRPENVYEIAQGKISPLCKKDFPDVLTPLFLDKAHHSFIRDNSATFLVRTDDKNCEIRVPLGASDLSTRSIAITEVDPFLLSRNEDGSIKVFESGDGREPVTYKVAVNDKELMSGLSYGDYRYDRKKIVWIEPKTRKVNMTDHAGATTCILEKPPEVNASLLGWNEDLELVCFQGRSRLYLYEIKTHAMREHPYEEYYRR